jgi:predicted CXXCH cytochrome family protein
MQAQATVKLTKHNLSAGTRDAGFTAVTGKIADYGEVCAYCHTPHSGSSSIPLWNRGATGTTYSMYSSTNSATINMTVGATPGPVSLACASCHDGTVGLDVITNKPNAASSVAALNQAFATVFTGALDALKVLGSDLTNDHPVAVTYDNTKDVAFASKATVEAAGLPFYGSGKDQLECGTCHNPHNNTNAPFLRKSNTASALCLTCHIK